MSDAAQSRDDSLGGETTRGINPLQSDAISGEWGLHVIPYEVNPLPERPSGGGGIPPASTGSPMAQMSRAIRETVEGHASTLQELNDDTLLQFSQIVSAFSLDLRDELKRRGDANSYEEGHDNDPVEQDAVLGGEGRQDVPGAVLDDRAGSGAEVAGASDLAAPGDPLAPPVDAGFAAKGTIHIRELVQEAHDRLREYEGQRAHALTHNQASLDDCVSRAERLIVQVLVLLGGVA